nr:hypothetical protein [Candidatus Dependentiae bacterium]
CTAIIWNAKTGTKITTLKWHIKRLCSAIFNSTGDQIITTSEDKTAVVWNVETEVKITTLLGHTSAVTAATFNHLGTHIITTSVNDTTLLWDTTTYENILKIPVSDAVLNSTSTTLVGWYWEKDPLKPGLFIAPFLWDIVQGKKIELLVKFPTSHITSHIMYTAFNQAGNQVIITLPNTTAVIVNSETGDLITTLTGHTGTISYASFNKTDDKVVTTSYDRTAKIWNTKTGDLLATLHKNDATTTFDWAAFTTLENSVLTLSNDGKLELWNFSPLMIEDSQNRSSYQESDSYLDKDSDELGCCLQ